VSGERRELARAGGVLNRMDERLPSRELADIPIGKASPSEALTHKGGR
jgi:hypothetical protein